MSAPILDERPCPFAWVGKGEAVLSEGPQARLSRPRLTLTPTLASRLTPPSPVFGRTRLGLLCGGTLGLPVFPARAKEVAFRLARSVSGSLAASFPVRDGCAPRLSECAVAVVAPCADGTVVSSHCVARGPSDTSGGPPPFGAFHRPPFVLHDARKGR